MAAVLLRRLLSSSFDEVYPSLAIDMQTAIKTELLAGIQSECTSNIRKKVCDIAAELSRNLIGELTLRFDRTKWRRGELKPCVFIPRWWRQQSVARDPQVPVWFGELSRHQSPGSSTAHFLVRKVTMVFGYFPRTDSELGYSVQFWFSTVSCSYRNFPGIFGNQQQHYLEVIKRMLVQCMQDQENPQVSV